MSSGRAATDPRLPGREVHPAAAPPPRRQARDHRLGAGERPRGAAWADRIELDVWYVEHRSLWLDLTILARTPFALFSGTYKGADGRLEGRGLDGGVAHALFSSPAPASGSTIARLPRGGRLHRRRRPEPARAGAPPRRPRGAARRESTIPATCRFLARHGRSEHDVSPGRPADRPRPARARGAPGELGALVLLPEPDVVERRTTSTSLTSSSRSTASTRRRPGCPTSFPDDLEFPVLVKPRRGFGSRNIFRAATGAELDFLLGYTPVRLDGAAACTGEEFSIDVFCDSRAAACTPSRGR